MCPGDGLDVCGSDDSARRWGLLRGGHRNREQPCGDLWGARGWACALHQQLFDLIQFFIARVSAALAFFQTVPIADARISPRLMRSTMSAART